jgi:hypothetical protein
MRYSIFHTSHCGSTLLACLLSKSIPTLTEPSWSHKIKFIDNIEDKLKLIQENHKEHQLVKYASFECNIALYLEGKKVFLYKDFKSHVNKMIEKNIYQENNTLQSLEWVENFSNLIKSNNVFFLESDTFLNNQKQSCEDICNFFEIEYKPIEIDFHVKQLGFNGCDLPIRAYP